MAETGLSQRLQSLDTLLSLLSRLGRWFPWWGTGIVGGISGWVAAATDWLNAYGPIAWWFAGLLGALIFAVLTAAATRALLWYSQSRHAVLKAKEASAGFNPLNTTFDCQRIKLSDFDPPLGVVNGKTITNCELLGPVQARLRLGV